MSFRITFMCLLFLGISTASYAKSKFKVGVQGLTYKPYSYVSSGEYRGAFRVLLDEFAEVNDIEFEYIALPIPRLYLEFYQGKLDFKVPANPYWQAKIKKQKGLEIYYSTPIFAYSDGVMTLPDKAKNKLKVLGVTSGFTPRDYLEKIESGEIIKKENPNIKGLLEQTMMGRIDGAYTNIAVGKYYLNNILNKTDSLIFAKEQAHTTSNYHMGTMKHPEIIKKLNLFLEKNKSKIQKIQQELNSGNYNKF